MASLAAPLMAAFFCRMAMTSTDAAFVGHLGGGVDDDGKYLAAAALANSCVWFLLTPALAFSRVLNALVAQAVGSGNPKMAGVWLQQSAFWTTLSMLPCLVGFFHVEAALIALGFPRDLSELAGTYAKYNVFWPIPNALYECMRFYFQAQGLPNPAMYNSAAFVLVNALLNYALVFGGPTHWRGLGFVGAAVSLSVSRIAQSAAYFTYMFLIARRHIPTCPGLSAAHHTRARTTEFMRQALPGMGTALFQSCVSNAAAVLIGSLGTRAVAASSVLTAATNPVGWTLAQTAGAVAAVRVGGHLGRGDADAARCSARIVLGLLTVACALAAAVLLPFGRAALGVVTDDRDVVDVGASLIPAALVGMYTNLLVSAVTCGVFSGMGRPVLATFLSFGFELPVSVGALALYILKFHGNLIGVYWLQARTGGVEAVVVLIIMVLSNWEKCADETRKRQKLV